MIESPCIIELKNVWFSYGSKSYAIRDLSLCIEPGEFVGIVGDNGSGKTTLLLILAGLLTPNRGKVVYSEVLGRDEDLRKNIAILFQDPENQLFQPTVKEELIFTLNQLRKTNRKDLIETARAFGLEKFLDKNPFSLSYGEKKIVVFGLIMSVNPKIIILDEPFAGLGPKYRSIIEQHITNASKSGKTVIIATHDPENIIHLANRFIVLEKGSIIFDGSKAEFLKSNIFERANIFDPCTKYRYLDTLCSKIRAES